jgi:hypothetical protein
MKIRDYSDVPPEVIKIIQSQNNPAAKNWQPYQGVLVSYLRPYNAKDKTDYLKFDKYYSLED